RLAPLRRRSRRGTGHRALRRIGPGRDAAARIWLHRRARLRACDRIADVGAMAKSAQQRGPATIWTIGHSTRSIDEFLGLLQVYRVEGIADVRRFPGSRKHPEFGRQALAATVQPNGIAYEWLEPLGGRRRELPDSPNTAWRNAAFRG